MLSSKVWIHNGRYWDVKTRSSWDFLRKYYRGCHNLEEYSFYQLMPGSTKTIYMTGLNNWTHSISLTGDDIQYVLVHGWTKLEW